MLIELLYFPKGTKLLKEKSWKIRNQPDSSNIPKLTKRAIRYRITYGWTYPN